MDTRSDSQSDNQSNAELLVQAFYAAFAVFVLVTHDVLAMIIGAILLYSEVRARSVTDKFELNNDDRAKLLEAERMLAVLEKRWAVIEYRGSQRKRNVDGSFHRGSRLGMELNTELEQIIPKYNANKAAVQRLLNKPLGLFDAWVGAKSYCAAFRISVVAYMCAFAFTSVAYAALCSIAMSVIGYFFWRRMLETDSRPNRNYWVQFAAGVGDQREAGAEEAKTAYQGRAGAGAGTAGQDRTGADAGTSGQGRAGAGAGTAGQDRDGERADTKGRRSDYGNQQAGAKTEKKHAPWQVALGVAPNASRAEINAAWRDKMAKNHPDLVAKMDPEFRVLAEERTKELNAAREEGLRSCKA